MQTRSKTCPACGEEQPDGLINPDQLCDSCSEEMRGVKPPYPEPGSELERISRSRRRHEIVIKLVIDGDGEVVLRAVDELLDVGALQSVISECCDDLYGGEVEFVSSTASLAG